MKRKIKARAGTFGLVGKRPELAIWVSDMFHHGRGSTSQVRAALALPTFAQQLDALSRIDTTGKHAARLKTVKKKVQVLRRGALQERQVRRGQPLSGPRSVIAGAGERRPPARLETGGSFCSPARSRPGVDKPV
jgi:hypothetical protein